MSPWTKRTAFWPYRCRQKDEAAACDQEELTTSDTSADPVDEIEQQNGNGEDEQYVELVTAELDAIVELAKRCDKTADAVEAERLRAEISNIILKLRQVESRIAKRRLSASTAVAPVGSCWRCDKTGHDWKLCAAHRPTDKTANFPYKPQCVDDRLTRARPSAPPQQFAQRSESSNGTSAQRQAAPRTKVIPAKWSSRQQRPCTPSLVYRAATKRTNRPI